MSSKIKSIDKIGKIVEGLKADGKVVVTTNGAYDILHAAHVNVFEKAKALGDVLIVLLNNDARVKASKGNHRPILPELERAKLVAALECVDYVLIFDDKLKYMETIKSDIHVKGGSVDPVKLKIEVDFVESWGGKHKVLELEKGYSTTNIIETILERHRNL